jgi:putative ABC transport system permease protein
MGDIRQALRLLRKNPGFTLATVSTLALAIGATTAVFSVVQGVLLRPLPYREPDRLVRVWEVSPQGDSRNVASAGNYLDWRDRARVFDAIGAHSGTFAVTLTGAGEPLTVGAARVTPSAFEALGVQAHAGRVFTEGEGGQGSPRTILMSDRLWQRRFGSDRAVLGRPVTLNDEPFAVVGIMRSGFAFPSADVDIWIAQQFSEGDRLQRRAHSFGVIARLKRDVTVERARAEMQILARQIADEQPAFMTGWSANVLAYHDDLVQSARPLVLILFGVATVVLLVACANLANLAVARTAGRAHEIAVRSALGASRARIARQLLIESLVQSIIGGALGVGIVAFALQTLVAAAPGDIPRLHDVGLDPAVFVFATAITVLCALAVGLLPALGSSRASSAFSGALWHEALSATRLSGTRHAARLRGALLVAQVALALVLLVGAGLLVRSLLKLNAVEYGFNADGLLALNLDTPTARYPDVGAQSGFYERLLERVRALPGVAAASTTSGAPASGMRITFSFAIEGRPAVTPSGREDPVPLRAVTPEYFRTLGVPIVRGRAIEPIDRQGAPPVVVLNESLAKRFWTDDPVGRRISFAGPEGPWYEVVGVVGDTRDDGLDQPAPPAVYVPFAQRREQWAWLSWQTLVVRARPGIEPTDLVSSIRFALTEIDPLLPLQSVSTVNGLYAESTARRRFAMQLTVGFAALALLLGALGIYAIVAYSVAERRREIGIRLALGAQPGTVLRQVVRGALGLAIAGAAIGIVSAVGLTRFLETLLFGVEPTDTATYAAMGTLLIAVAALAAWLPARHVMRVDPVTALKTD